MVCSLAGALKLVSASRSVEPMSLSLNSFTTRQAMGCMLFSKHLLIIARHTGFRSSTQYRLVKVKNFSQ